MPDILLQPDSNWDWHEVLLESHVQAYKSARVEKQRVPASPQNITYLWNTIFNAPRTFQNHALRSRPFSLVVLKQTHVKLVRLHSKRKLHKLSESQLQFNRRSLFSKNKQNKTDHKVTTP